MNTESWTLLIRKRPAKEKLKCSVCGTWYDKDTCPKCKNSPMV